MTMPIIQTVHGTVCQTCNKKFSGTVPLHQHLQSAEHQRKLQQQEQEGGALQCTACNIPCNSQRQLAEHLQSPRHQQVVERSAQIQQLQCLTRESLQRQRWCAERLVQGASSDQEPPGTSAETVGDASTMYPVPKVYGHIFPVQKMQVAGMQMPGMGNLFPPSLPPPTSGVEQNNEYVFANGRGHCYVCNIELTSAQHKKQHIEGNKHKKKAMQGGGSVDGTDGVMMCSICNVALSGQLNVEQHFSSEKHNRKADAAAIHMTPPIPPQQPSIVQSTQVTGGTTPVFVPVGINRAPSEQNSSRDFIPNISPNISSWKATSVAEISNGEASRSTSLMQSKLASETMLMKNREQTTSSSKNAEQGRPRFYYCPICNLQFDKGHLMQEHLVSPSHKQQEKCINSLKCDVCNESFTDTESSSEHYHSDVHIKNRDFRANSVYPSSYHRPELESNFLGSSQYKNIMSSDLSHIMSHTLDQDETLKKLLGVEPVSQEAFRLIAPDSGKDASVQSTALNHLSGETKSAAPLTQFNIPPVVPTVEEEVGSSGNPVSGALPEPSTIQEVVFDGRRGVCNACSVTLTSPQLAHSHLAGAKHQKASQRWRVAQMSTLSTRGFVEGSSVQPFTTNESTVRTESGTKAYKFDGERGYCFACKIDLTSVAHANQHLVGRKHQMAVERWVQEGQGCVYPLYCSTCHKPFTGQESAAQHFSSEKHKKKMLLTAEADPNRIDPSTGALIVIQDGQTWYVCNVCKCPLNTREQMEIHLRSPRHLKEQEKVHQQPTVLKSEQEPNPLLLVDGNISSSEQTLEKASAVSEKSPPDLRHLITCSPILKVQQPANLTQVLLPPRLTVGPCTGPSNHGALTGPSLEMDGPAHNSNSSSTAHGERQNGQTQDFSAYSSGMFWQGMPGNFSDLQLDLTGTAGQGNMGRGQLPADLVNDLHNLNVSISRSQVRPGLKNNRSGRSAAQVLRRDGNYGFDDDNEGIMKEMPTSPLTSYYDDSAVSGNREHIDLRERDSVSSICSGSYQMSLTQSELTQHDASSMVSSDLSLSDGQQLTSIVGSLSTGINDSLPGTQLQRSQHVPQTMFPGFKFSCNLCRKPMNTKEDYDKHVLGLKHQRQTASVCAPDKSREPLMKKDLNADYEKAYSSLNKSTPRVYQVELMRKAMTDDSTVIFLPTGTGKTLVAMMTISYMLTLNPTRPVLFLVDKVLLVLQQARYIINELGSKNFRRPNLQNDQLEERKLKVAVLCGGLNTRDGTPIYKHDVIVTTAAFCQNLLMEGVLRWSNLSLVVFDEAHHCTKSHPYNCLLRDYHLKLVPESRPKVLGLTASPAGRRTKEETLQMLQELLNNLGDACIATVDNPSAREQLEKFSSSARLIPICVPMTEAEMRFHMELLAYFIRAYIELMRCSNLHQMSNKAFRDIINSNPLEESQVQELAKRLMHEPDELSEMFQLVQSARNKPSVDSSRFETIRLHVMTVGMSLLNSEDGIDFVLEDLDREFNPLLNQNLSELLLLGLPCDTIAKFVQTLCDAARVRDTDARSEGEAGTSPSSMSIFQELLGTLKDAKYMGWGTADAMALVLVRERKVAHKIKEQLKRTSFVRERKMRVAVVVGHGAGGGEGEGMNLRKQDRVLQGIRAHRYQIVVATSVAEEGVDIPECQLVVCLNPPTTLKAMVQMRGRARKKDSYFVVLCSSQREKEKLEGLQKQEDNMKWAAAQLAQQNCPANQS